MKQNLKIVNSQWLSVMWALPRLFAIFLTASFIALVGSTALSGQVPSGNGSGEFFPPVSYSVAEDPKDMAVADLNQDGLIDVILGTADSRLIQILLGNGDGTFDATQIPAMVVPDEVLEIITGQFDGDGNPDLLLLTEDDQNLYLLRGSNSGALQNPELIYFQTEPIRSLAVGDLNNDNQDDVVISSSCGFAGCPPTRILMSDGAGNLVLDPISLPTSTLTMIEDLDGDGDLDVLLGSVQLVSYLNDGSGNLSPLQEIFITYEIDEMILIDALVDNPDGVGILDLVCLTADGDGLAFLAGFGDGTFGTPVERYGDELDSAEDMTPAQLDGVGTPDLLFYSNADEELIILYGHGEDGIPYQDFISYPLPPDPTCLKIADFNNDGVLDVVSASSSQDLLTVFIGKVASDDFRRGDANGDNVINLADPVTVLEALFIVGTGVSGCADAYDANDDGTLDLADPVATLMFLFGFGPILPAPFPDCGPDPTSDALECQFALDPPCP